MESETAGQFVSDKLVVGGTLQGKEVLKKLLHWLRPSETMAAGEAQGKGAPVLEPCGAEAEEVGTRDAEELGGGVGVEITAVERV